MTWLNAKEKLIRYPCARCKHPYYGDVRTGRVCDGGGDRYDPKRTCVYTDDCEWHVKWSEQCARFEAQKGEK